MHSYPIFQQLTPTYDKRTHQWCPHVVQVGEVQAPNVDEALIRAKASGFKRPIVEPTEHEYRRAVAEAESKRNQAQG